MKITILGSGTSTGVPLLGCLCSVCKSQNPKNKRTRASVLLETGGTSILIDTSVDFRSQALRENVREIQAILYTHAHADHLLGLDDIRPLNFLHKKSIPCYGNAQTVSHIKTLFSYIFSDTQEGGGKPRISLTEIGMDPFEISRILVRPVPLWHGSLSILGYRIGGFAYLTDCSSIPEESFAMLQDLDILVLGALRQRVHPTHFSIGQAIEASQKIKAGRTWFTHLGHEIDHDVFEASLPPGVFLAYDGLKIEI
ncbi:MAG: MBL fold metallo-hydrolase [Candidatus Aureabacteria bacterium]|nr:MBL fold metallo-hydrolase [Candidatus Auribacterota bacterium]